MSGCACVECVQQSDAAVVEKWGGFSHTLGPGMNFVLWPVYQVAGTLSLKVQQLEVKCETKTLDNVFIEVIVAIQYNVLQEKVSEAFYELTNPRRQITAYVYDVVRSTLPRNTLIGPSSRKRRSPSPSRSRCPRRCTASATSS